MFADPIADRGHLGDTAAQIGERERAEQFIGHAEDEKRIGHVAFDVAHIALDPAPECGAVRSSAGQVGSHGVKNARLESLSAAHAS